MRSSEDPIREGGERIKLDFQSQKGTWEEAKGRGKEGEWKGKWEGEWEERVGMSEGKGNGSGN